MKYSKKRKIPKTVNMWGVIQLGKYTWWKNRKALSDETRQEILKWYLETPKECLTGRENLSLVLLLSEQEIPKEGVQPLCQGLIEVALTKFMLEDADRQAHKNTPIAQLFAQGDD